MSWKRQTPIQSFGIIFMALASAAYVLAPLAHAGMPPPLFFMIAVEMSFVAGCVMLALFLLNNRVFTEAGVGAPKPRKHPILDGRFFGLELNGGLRRDRDWGNRSALNKRGRVFSAEVVRPVHFEKMGGLAPLMSCVG